MGHIIKTNILPLNSSRRKSPQIHFRQLHFRGKLARNYLEHYLNNI